MNKIFVLGLPALLVVFCLSGCVNKTENDPLSFDNQEDEMLTNDKAAANISSEILNTSLDLGDWAEYKSDKYGYGIMLPADYKFLPEGENAISIEFDPEAMSFEAGKVARGEAPEHLINFSIVKEDIDLYVAQRQIETGRKNYILKAFSRDGHDYYYHNPDYSSNFYEPSLIYKDGIILALNCSQKIDEETYRAILGSVKIF